MLEVSELLQSYVHGVRRLTGADAVSLFVPSASGGQQRALLVHDGEAEPLAELADHDAATAFLEARIAGVSSAAKASSSSRLGRRLPGGPVQADLGLFAAAAEDPAALEALRSLDLDALTPIEALVKLQELQRQARGE